MNIEKILFSFLIVFTATALLAAEAAREPQSKTAAAEIAATVKNSLEPVIPERKLKFDVTEQEEPLPLEKVQEGMLDERYVATFKLAFPKIERTAEPAEETSSGRRIMLRGFGGGISNVENENVIGLADENILLIFGQRRLPGNIDQSRILNTVRKFHNSQQMLLFGAPYQFRKFPTELSFLFDNAPEEHRLPKEDFWTFVNKSFGENIVSNEKSDKNTPVSIQIRLLAPTAEQAKKWVEAWLALYDWGLCFPAQKESLNTKNKHEQSLTENIDKLSSQEKELADAKQEVEKYKDFEDIKPEAILNLTTQRRLLSVDLAGIKARINACEEMLAQKGASGQRKEQIESALVTAQIELRGLDAKQAEIDRIIQGAQIREKLTTKIESLGHSIPRLKNIIENTKKAIQEIEEYQLGYYPVPVEDGKVTIRRIKWVSPANKPQSEKP